MALNFEFCYLVGVVGNYDAFFDMGRKGIALWEEGNCSSSLWGLRKGITQHADFFFYFICSVFSPEKCGLFWLKIGSLYD